MFSQELINLQIFYSAASRVTENEERFSLPYSIDLYMVMILVYGLHEEDANKTGHVSWMLFMLVFCALGLFDKE